MNTITTNALGLERELAWFDRVLEAGFSLFFEQDSAFESTYDIPAPSLDGLSPPRGRAATRRHNPTGTGAI